MIKTGWSKLQKQKLAYITQTKPNLTYIKYRNSKYFKHVFLSSLILVLIFFRVSSCLLPKWTTKMNSQTKPNLNFIVIQLGKYLKYSKAKKNKTTNNCCKCNYCWSSHKQVILVGPLSFHGIFYSWLMTNFMKKNPFQYKNNKKELNC